MQAVKEENMFYCHIFYVWLCVSYIRHMYCISEMVVKEGMLKWWSLKLLRCTSFTFISVKNYSTAFTTFSRLQ